MIKGYSLQFVSTLILFLIINLTYFWEGELGMLTFPLFFILFISFFILLVEFIRQIYISIRNKFSDKKRNFIVIFMTICLALIVIKPRGIINFEKLEGENLYFAQAEGAANCTSTLKLKKSNKFVYESVCFGIQKTKGFYELKNDSIYFKNFDTRKFEFKFGKINNNTISLYRNVNDKFPFQIPILKK